TVFKSKWLNALFLNVWCILIMFNYRRYKLSHTYHHLYTLHQAADGEVVLPKALPTKLLTWLQLLTFDLTGFVKHYLSKIRIVVTGKYHDEWSARIFTPKQAVTFKRAIRWERFVLGFHIAVFILSAISGLWMITVLLTLGNHIGGWYITLLGGTMHAGLRDNVPDFRLCCRTIKLDPFSGFLRWNMHYHIEHHMFAAVPCYNLGMLYRTVASDMPERRTLFGAWKEMMATQRRQRTEPDYQFDTPLPPPKGKATELDPLAADIGDIRPTEFVESPPDIV
ncbi:MAG: fatty acid desaturase, partial [Spirochaetales bacterium]|nr:fatty acid desaturase [Spirochaetales bacterium]